MLNKWIAVVLICILVFVGPFGILSSEVTGQTSKAQSDVRTNEPTNRDSPPIIRASVCIDDSSSMRTGNLANDPKYQRLDAVLNFINWTLKDGDELAIYRFDSTSTNGDYAPTTARVNNLYFDKYGGSTWEGYPFENQSWFLKDRGYPPNWPSYTDGGHTFNNQGNTPLYDCFVKALNDQMASYNPPANLLPVVIVITDGMDSASTSTYVNAYDKAASGGLPLFTAGLGGAVDDNTLFTLAEKSNGGKYISASNASYINATMKLISEAIGARMGRALKDEGKDEYGTSSRDTLDGPKASSRAITELRLLNPARSGAAGTTEKWGVGSSINITWRCMDNVDQSKCGHASINLSLDNGVTWTNVANNTGTRVDNVAGWTYGWYDRNGGVWYTNYIYVYNWTVPTIPTNITNTAKIRIRETGANGVALQVDSRTFTIFKMGISPVIRIKLFPLNDNLLAQEDARYQEHYWATGGTNLNWVFESNASWLKWNATAHNITGTPDNSDVGWYWVRINASLGVVSSDEHNFTLRVNNTPPGINTSDVKSAIEDQLYRVDYNSTDDGQGQITWHLVTSAGAWLSIGTNNGISTGIPSNDDVGQYDVNVSVDDGNGGWNSTHFTLAVLNVNDPPQIIGADITEVDEDTEYKSNYSVKDIDKTDTVFTWSLDTNASWLKIDTSTGRITGLPDNSDVGQYRVNVTVKDPAQALDFRNFTLTVKNVNDPPVWVDVPKNLTIKDTDTYTFDVNASDIDVGDILTYHIAYASTPTVSIDAKTGIIICKPNSAGIYLIDITVTDNIITLHYEFQITVIHVVINIPPECSLSSPADGSKIVVQNPTFNWTVSDENGDNITSDLYLSKNRTMVEELDASTKIALTLTNTYFTPLSVLDKGATYYWTVIPYDGSVHGNCNSGIWSFSISENASINHLPKFVSDPPLEAGAGVEWAYAPRAVDEDVGDTVTINLVTSPVGMSMTAGTIKWTPTADQLGKHFVKIEATDGKGSVFQGFTVVVTTEAPSNHAPQISPVDPVSVKAGQRISVQIIATDPDSDPLTYSIVGAIPSGLQLNATGQLTWTTQKGDEGIYTLVIKVSDGKLSTTGVVKITVESNPSPPPHKVRLQDNLAVIGALVLIIIVACLLIIFFAIRQRRTKDEIQTAQETVQEDAPRTHLEAQRTAVVVEDFSLDEVFLLYRDGRLIAHASPKESIIDDQLFDGMLKAVQGSIKGSFQAEEGPISFEFGSRKINLHKGDSLYLAVAFSGAEPKMLTGQMKELLQKLGGLYAVIVEDWNGDTGSFKNVGHYLSSLFGVKEGLNPKEEKKVEPPSDKVIPPDEGAGPSIPRPSSEPKPQGPLCPTCGKEIEPAWNKCHHCGSKIKKAVKKIKQSSPKSTAQPVLQEMLCSQCFTALDPKWTMCPECGLELEKNEAEPKSDVSDDIPEPAEKK